MTTKPKIIRVLVDGYPCTIAFQFERHDDGMNVPYGDEQRTKALHFHLQMNQHFGKSRPHVFDDFIVEKVTYYPDANLEEWVVGS